MVIDYHKALSEACPQRLLSVYGEERQVERLLIINLALPVLAGYFEANVQFVQNREFLQVEISLMR